MYPAYCSYLIPSCLANGARVLMRTRFTVFQLTVGMSSLQQVLVGSMLEKFIMSCNVPTSMIADPVNSEAYDAWFTDKIDQQLGDLLLCGEQRACIATGWQPLVGSASAGGWTALHFALRTSSPCLYRASADKPSIWRKLAVTLCQVCGCATTSIYHPGRHTKRHMGQMAPAGGESRHE